MKTQWLLGAIAASLVSVSAAHAASYNFDVLYSGGGVATLQPGSDDMTATSMLVGEDFTYTLSAEGAGAWKALNDDGIFPLFAIGVNESASRNIDYTLNLLNNGATVFSLAENGVGVSYVHIGTNTQSLTAGLVFDQWVLHALINSSDSVEDPPLDTATPSGLLPIFGAPEDHAPNSIAYSTTGFSAVPEPASWALMIGGFALTGAALRQRRRLAFA